MHFLLGGLFHQGSLGKKQTEICTYIVKDFMLRIYSNVYVKNNVEKGTIYLLTTIIINEYIKRLPLYTDLYKV